MGTDHDDTGDDRAGSRHREPPGLAGRAAEWAELSAALTRLRAGRGGLVLLSGEPGIGKTALAEATAEHAAGTGVQVLWGRCWEAGGAPPLWPWTEALRGWPERTGLAEAVAGLGSAGALLTPLLEPGSASAPLGGGDPERARFALFDAVGQVFAALTRARPVLVVLDDLHVADVPSLLLLEVVAARAGQLSLLIVGCHREAELEADAERGTVLARTARLGRRLPVRGLHRDEVARLAEATSGAAVPAALVAQLHEVTGGNPFFVDEVTRLLAAEGRLEQGVVAVVPAGVRATVRQRLARLSPRCRDTLALAAVAGRDFELPLLRSLGNDAYLLDALDEARRAGLIIDRSDAVGGFRFTHVLVRDTLYDDQTAEWRRAAHQRVGEAMELVGAVAAVPAALTAHHFWHALPGPAADRAVHHSWRASQEALARYAYEEAYAQAQRARQATSLPGAADDTTRCTVTMELATAGNALGVPLAERRRLYAEAAELAERTRDAASLVRAVLGYAAYSSRGYEPPVVAMLERALRVLGDSAARGPLLTELALQVAYECDAARVDALAQEGTALAAHEGPHDLLLALTRHVAALLTLGPEHVRRHLEVGDRLQQVAADTADERLVAMGRVCRSWMLSELGRWSEARRDHAAAANWYDKHQPGWTGHGWRGLAAAWDGRFGDLEISAAEMVAAGERAGDPTPTQWGVLMGFLAHRERAPARLDEDARLLAGLPAAPVLGRTGHLVALVESDRLDELRAELALWAPDGLAQQVAGWSGGRRVALGMLADAVTAVGDAARAAALLPLISPMSGLSLGFGGLPYAPADHALGSLHTVLGQWAEAEACFESAIGACATMPALLARVHHDCARMLLTRDAPGDRARATELAAAAAHAARRLGMHRLAVRAAGLLERPSHEVAAAPSPAPDRVFRRDGEVWTLQFGPEAIRLKDSKGLRTLALLLANPGRELHALDLTTGEQSRDGVRGSDLAATTGEPLLDEQARRAYQRRLTELREERDAAEQDNDLGRADRAQGELDALESELRRAYGLGGRARTDYTPAERARLSVTKTVRSALDRIEEHAPALAAHLRATIHTGTYCSYSPDPAGVASWKL